MWTSAFYRDEVCTSRAKAEVFQIGTLVLYMLVLLVMLETGIYPCIQRVVRERERESLDRGYMGDCNTYNISNICNMMACYGMIGLN